MRLSSNRPIQYCRGMETVFGRRRRKSPDRYVRVDRENTINNIKAVKYQAGKCYRSEFLTIAPMIGLVS